MAHSSKSADSPRPPAAQLPAADAQPKETSTNGQSFSIVAVGASAGGLEALQRLVSALPPDTGMAFVLILHLAPKHESALAEIIARSTRIPVREAEERMQVEPNHVYVMRPATEMLFTDGRLQIEPRVETRGVHHPIDLFMRSLAEARRERAIGVVLSGTGSDGTLGIVEIKASGGITFAQDDSAQQTTMPRNAVAAGGVDFVLSPEAIAQEIARIAAHPFVRTEPTHDTPVLDPALFERLFEVLRSETGLQFSDYRRNTINRRVLRRMALQRLDRLEDYVQFVSGNPAEAEALYQDILINVTSFFRDPEAFEAVKQAVFPRITESRSRTDPVRVWVLGCSTGQDAYSIAMSFNEYLEASGRRSTLQVFASDVNGVGIETARAGVYSKGIEQDVSHERLQRFFTHVDGSYRIAKPIRDMCIFARHDALSEPPFSRLDFVVCRNMLIYLEPVLQRRLLPTLHYALQPRGFLWLGSSETAGAYAELFEPVDSRHRIYARKPGARRGHPNLSAAPAAVSRRPVPHPQVIKPGFDREAHKDAERLLLARYAPPAVVVDQSLNVEQFRGDTSPYLVPPQGRASLNLLKMLREGLLVGVRGAVHQAWREAKSVRAEDLVVVSEGGERRVNVVAIPVLADQHVSGVVVVFEEPGEGGAAQDRQAREESAATTPLKKRENSREEAHRLRQELAATREYLQSVIEQLEAANEELQASNEEAQSSNEELQSVNEELETSKEEIESTNEELTTVNDELQKRNRELTESNSDLANLIASVQMPIVILDTNLRIRRFTPAAEKLLNLLGSDVGRPISDIKLNIDVPDIDQLFERVMRHGSVEEREARDRHGHWNWLRVRPYSDAQGAVQGALVMLIDIDAIKRANERLSESEGRFAVMADSAPVLVWVHSLDGCEFVNQAYEAFAGVSARELWKRGWTAGLHPDDRAAYLAAYHAAFDAKTTFEALARFRRADGEYRWMKSTGVPRLLEGGDFAGYVGSSVDITDLKEAEQMLRQADRLKDEFLATLGHELRNPLAAISNAAYLLGSPMPKDSRFVLGIIERQTRNMIRIVDDLLDVSRITHGKIQLRIDIFDVEVVARHAIAATDHERLQADQALQTSFTSEPAWVRGDPARFEQVLTNLLTNASKFAPSNGRLGLAVDRAAKDGAPQVCVRVTDNGPGIDPKVLPRIFELFVQGERMDDRARTGVGIGLALARHLVDLQGGSIEARNRPEGGSEFRVCLPAMAPPATDRFLGAIDATAESPRRVLVVDDNSDAAIAVQAILEHAGHEVRIAAHGQAALAEAVDFAPEVVLLDIGLPDFDGVAVGRKLREDPRTRDVKLVALSGYGREGDIERTREAGFDGHLTKPADPGQLLQAVAQPRAPGATH